MRVRNRSYRLMRAGLIGLTKERELQVQSEPAQPRDIFSFINSPQFGHIRTFALTRSVTLREYQRDICTRKRVVWMSRSATWRRLRAGEDIDTTVETSDI